MRLKDVQVGKEYEYQRWTGSKKFKVTAIKVGVHLAKYNYKGVSVQDETGRRFSTPARCLLRLWAEAEKFLEEREEREREVRKIISELHDIRIGIEAILSRAGVDAYVSVFENKPALMIRVSDPDEAIKILVLMGGRQCNIV